MNRRLAAAALSVALACASPAGAEPRPKPLATALTGEARSYYEVGKKSFRERSWEGAREAFEQAYARSKDARLLWNVAACERKLGRNARVYELVTRYLDEGGAALTREEQAEARRALAAARELVARVSVDAEPGLDVTLDAEPLGATPVAPFYVDRGRHVLRYTRAGHKPLEQDVDFDGGKDVVLRVALEPEAEAPGSSSPSPPPPAAPAARRDAPATPAPSTPRARSRVPLVIGGLGALALVSGGVVFGLSYAHYTKLEGECSPACDASRWETARTTEVVGDVLMVTGAAALGVAVVLYLVDRPAAASAHASPMQMVW